MTEEVIRTAFEAGWAVGLLALVLAAIGTGIGLFLRVYLCQQKAEYAASQVERDRKNRLLDEQQDFIRRLADVSIQERTGYIESYLKITVALDEINHSLASLNKTYNKHVAESSGALSELRKDHGNFNTELRTLERTFATANKERK